MIARLIGTLALLSLAPPTLAWDAHGHRTIALLAVDRLEAAAPEADRAGPLAFVLAPSGRAQVGYQAGEPDRYRAVRLGQLKHENDPDHYIDLEDLEPFGLTLRTVPPLRYEYLRAMAIAKHEHPEDQKPYNERRDPARTQEFPGYLPHAILEHYGKLISSFRQIRILQRLVPGPMDDPIGGAAADADLRSEQFAAARANCLFEMGQLAHFVGDAAQPLHTTRHHHGWVGDNPEGFTTNNGFHAYIDTTVLGIHHLDYTALKDACKEPRAVNKDDPWNDVLDEIQRAFDQVRPLYALQKSGDLDREPGRALIVGRLCDGAATLGALYAAAWEASAITDKDVEDFVHYDRPSRAEPNPMEKKGRSSESTPSKEPEPTTAPAPTAP